MSEIINSNDREISNSGQSIGSLARELLVDAREISIPQDKSISMPLAELTTLGAGVSSLLPAFNTVTQTSTVNMQGVYQLANQSLGDSLKVASDGNFWGAFKTMDGGSKFAKLKAADPISTSNSIVMHANPATIMMAVALFSIEKELGNIREMQKKIVSFLEIEKEAEIEADIITLTEIVTKYKHNWDNEHYITSNHKLVCDIQRTARKNMISFQKQVSEAVKTKQFIVAGNKVNSALKDMQKKFKYYRLAVYTFALSSMTEIILSGNFKEENLESAINETNRISNEYRSLFNECSLYLERLSKGSIETNVLKGIGTASNAVGRFIGSIPKVKDGPVDEFLIDKGARIKGNAQGISEDVIDSFSEVSNPSVSGIVNRLEDLNKIYNHTSAICFDNKNLYLLVG